jgi:hypothetical protein
MSKTIRTALIIGVVLMMVAGIVYLESEVKGHASTAEGYKSSLEIEEADNSRLKNKVKVLKGRNEELLLDNGRLTRKNAMLRDSVKSLNVKVRKLNKTIQEQASLMAVNESRMKELQAKSQELVERISMMKDDRNADKEIIVDLDKKRQALDKEIGELFVENEKLEVEALDGTKELAKATKEADDKERILEIVEAVKVNFKSIYPRRDESRRARNVKQWKLTVINMELMIEEADLIIGETFIAKIIDKDSGKIMAPRESNGGANDTQGETFVFKGNPVPSINYSNYQEKAGKNYILQIFYVKDDKNYPLKNGSKDISFKKN